MFNNEPGNPKNENSYQPQTIWVICDKEWVELKTFDWLKN